VTLDALRRAWAAFRGDLPRWTPAKSRMDHGVFFTDPPAGDSWEGHEDALVRELDAARNSGAGLALRDLVESQKLAAMQACAEALTEEDAHHRRVLYQCWSLVEQKLTGAMGWRERELSIQRQRERMNMEEIRAAELRRAGRTSVLG